MDLGLRDKKVLVTGSTAGIGFASAKLFAKEGAQVWVNGRTADRTESAIAAIAKEVPGAKLLPAVGDVSNAKGIEAIEKAAPAIDVLVNNAGIFEPKAFEDIPDADWMRFFETNVLSGVRLSRKYLPDMLKKNWGRILFISSESALQIPVEMIHYGTTKTAQLAVARGLAERVARTGVTVNSILPGPTKSEGVVRFVKALADKG
ncbi:MAG: SDR family oxidoreductase, partial [Polyangiaceae bacterium]